MGPKEKRGFHIRIQVPGRSRLELNMCHLASSTIQVAVLSTGKARQSGRWRKLSTGLSNCLSRDTASHSAVQTGAKAFPFVLLSLLVTMKQSKRKMGWKLHCRRVDYWPLCGFRCVQATNLSFVCVFICLFISNWSWMSIFLLISQTSEFLTLIFSVLALELEKHSDYVFVFTTNISNVSPVQKC